MYSRCMNKKLIAPIIITIALIVTVSYSLSSIERKPMAESNSGITLSSQFDIILTGSVALTKPANSTYAFVDVAHGLDQIPMVLCYFTSTTNNDGVYFETPFVWGELTTGLMSLNVRVYSDATNISFAISTPNVASANNYYSTARTFTFHYFVLRQKIIQ